MVRLDRALVSASWIARYTQAMLSQLDGATSDHGLILLKFDGKQQDTVKRKVFRYETMWESHEAWRDKIIDCRGALAPGYGLGEFRDKLLRISKDISAWGIDRFGSVQKEMKQIRAKL